MSAPKVKPPTPAIALSIESACASLDVSWDFWREYVEPQVKVIRIGRLKRVAVAELERWAAEHGEQVLNGNSTDDWRIKRL